MIWTICVFRVLNHRQWSLAKQSSLIYEKWCKKLRKPGKVKRIKLVSVQVFQVNRHYIPPIRIQWLNYKLPSLFVGFSFLTYRSYYSHYKTPHVKLRSKMNIILPYHSNYRMQYCWDKTIAQSGDRYRDDSGIFSLVIENFGITNTSVQNFAIRISSIITVPKCLRKLRVFLTNLI